MTIIKTLVEYAEATEPDKNLVIELMDVVGCWVPNGISANDNIRNIRQWIEDDRVRIQPETVTLHQVEHPSLGTFWIEEGGMMTDAFVHCEPTDRVVVNGIVELNRPDMGVD